MAASGVRPDAHFVEWIMKALAVEGQWAIAVAVLESLQRQQAEEGTVSLSNVVYNLVIKACDAGGEWKTAVKLVEAMRQGGMHPDLYSFNTAISACQKAGKVRQITRLLSRMEDGYPPVPPNAFTFITATTACLQAGAFDKLFEVIKNRRFFVCLWGTGN